MSKLTLLPRWINIFAHLFKILMDPLLALTEGSYFGRTWTEVLYSVLSFWSHKIGKYFAPKCWQLFFFTWFWELYLCKLHCNLLFTKSLYLLAMDTWYGLRITCATDLPYFHSFLVLSVKYGSLTATILSYLGMFTWQSKVCKLLLVIQVGVHDGHNKSWQTCLQSIGNKWLAFDLSNSLQYSLGFNWQTWIY